MSRLVDDPGGRLSATPDGLGGTCAAVATPAWLTGGCPSYPRAWLSPIDAPFGRVDTLEVFSRKALAPALAMGQWVSVTGHVDDSQSSTCRLTGPEPGQLAQPAATSVKICRTHFVATSVSTVAPPVSPAVNPDPAAFLPLPAGMREAPDFQGWDNLALPNGTTYGFRDITPPGGLGVVVTVFQARSAAAAGRVETAVLGTVGPTTSGNVLGVTVSRTGGGSEAVFVVRSRTYELQIPSEIDGLTPEQAASLQAVLEALIGAVSAG